MPVHTALRFFLYVIALLPFIPSINCAPRPGLLQVLGAQGVNFWKLEAARTATWPTSGPAKRSSALFVQDSQMVGTTDFRARWFQQPLDHFSDTSTYTFHQRYWVNDRHYVPKSGAPVIVLDGGETNGEVCIIRQSRMTLGKRLVGPAPVFRHRNCRHFGQGYWRCWSRVGASVLWYVSHNILLIFNLITVCRSVCSR